MASASGNGSCVNLQDACVTPDNTSSTGYPAYYRGFSTNVSNYAGLTYADGTNVNDRVNSVRVRTEFTSYTGVCWYKDAGYGTPRTYRGQYYGSWYDNSSVDLSAHAWVGSSCV